MTTAVKGEHNIATGDAELKNSHSVDVLLQRSNWRPPTKDDGESCDIFDSILDGLCEPFLNLSLNACENVSTN